MRGLKQKILLKISKDLLEESLISFKHSPKKEKVILWLGRRVSQNYIVEEVYTPLQNSGSDSFRIPEEGMEMLMKKLRLNRRMIVAQVHTHPFKAFHSVADNIWAIVRHVGAYSLVLPYFGKTTNLENISINVAIFRIDELNNWKEVDADNLKLI